MPWADIIIILLIAAAAFIGYSVGLLGAVKGFIGSLAGLVGAWILTPLAQAWLEGVWGVESMLAGFLATVMPSSLRTLIRQAGETARSLQEIKDGLLSLSLPPEVALYLQRALEKTPAETAPSPELLVNVLAGEVARSILWAVLFILIWSVIAFVIRSFLGLLFVSGDGKTILGVFDGVLGMISSTVLVVAFLVVFCGLVYPIVLVSDSGGGISRIYPYLLNSKLIGWLSGIYQLYVIPWIA